MLSWWPAEGNANDFAGGRDGRINNAAFAPGKVGQTFSFTGQGWVEVPDDPAWTLGTRAFTIEMWVNFNSIQGRDAFIGHDEGGGETDKWIFWFDRYGHYSSYDALRLHVNSEGHAITGPIDPAAGPWSPQIGRWYHVAVTRDGSTYALYVDGVAIATSSDATPMPDPDAPLTIGRAESFLFDGQIDEVSIYTRALAAQEVAGIASAGSAGKCGPRLLVKVDVMPFVSPNVIEYNSRTGTAEPATLPVAVYSSANFDATQVAIASVRLGSVAALASCSPFRMGGFVVACNSTDFDLDGDGRKDLVLGFDTKALIAAGDLSTTTSAAQTLTLTGDHRNGRQFTGSDQVTVNTR